ncbi:MAG: dynamin family protein [Desulfobacterales bacterium]|uniref:Dynamin family protein n=1 Tax=Candidatus Desulfatibia vada TaxID=2841696 RepID=A0A8J6TST8_9BACT|nr:dynamin family protein [Candidatus Desulfatibia vada]MBL6970887.1 dynamin family protein [Desulfobacterales bacterium]
MDTYTSLKKELLEINQKVNSLFPKAQSITGMADHTFGDWQKTCSGINKQIADEIIRIAVVGPIKSGKSTFTNALFKGDYFKRGAGVVTSIVTRARRGETLKAKLLFKSWIEINSDIRQALVMFPALSRRSENDGFDIRRKKERTDLQKAIDALSAEQLITKGVLNAGSMQLSSYLKGYERIKEIVSADNVVQQYQDDRFTEYRAFVGDETLAVYLKDVQLEINSGVFDKDIEIADCQGSDAPNPLHIAMIQDYLLLTHFITYVISSRTGLREADIKFLSMIKKMGIMDNIMFVVNCDFSEHESIDDFNALIKKVEEELSLIKPEPEIYSFSALYNLFKEQRSNLSPKDSSRLDQWERERELAAFSDRESSRFKESLHHKLTRERYSLLLKNHLERLDVIATGLDNWISINQNILSKDAGSANQIIEKLKHHQGSMNQMKSVIKNTLDGANQKIEQKLRADIDRFFDVRTGNILKNIIEFIRGYQISYHDHEENLKQSGFSSTLYLIFQEFKHALDSYMTESVNPEIVRFIRQQEAWIGEHLNSIAGPYELMVQDALTEYSNLMDSFGVGSLQKRPQKINLPDMDSIKSMIGLSLPPAVASLRYTARMQTEAVVRFGFYTVVKIFKRLIRKPVQSKNEGGILALKDGVLQMKRETERSIVYLFKDYQENLKFQYIFKLVEAVSNKLYDALLDRFQAYVADLSNIVDIVSNKKIDKQRTSELLKEMELISQEISQRITAVREEIDTTDQ